jgi:hypothetical protein
MYSLYGTSGHADVSVMQFYRHQLLRTGSLYIAMKWVESQISCLICLWC